MSLSLSQAKEALAVASSKLLKISQELEVLGNRPDKDRFIQERSALDRARTNALAEVQAARTKVAELNN